MPPLRPRAALTVLGAFFIALAAAATTIGVLPADAAVREALLGWATPAIVGLMRIVNRAGDWRLLLPGTLLLFVAFIPFVLRWIPTASLAAVLVYTGYKLMNLKVMTELREHGD